MSKVPYQAVSPDLTRNVFAGARDNKLVYCVGREHEHCILTFGTAPTRILLMREHSRTWPSCKDNAERCRNECKGKNVTADASNNTN